jgi:hypothetical protein
MHLEFDETFSISPATAYDYFKSPHDWPRLFGAFGTITDRGNGWLAVPLRRSPFPLIARTTIDEPAVRVAWDLRGFWSGDGEVRFEALGDGTRITGHETVNLPRLLGLRVLVERWAEPRFAAVWESGWRKLRRLGSG